MLEWLQQTFLAPWHEPFFIKALVGSSIVAVVCSVVGCLVILRRMAFLGDALSHSMIAGVVAGYLFMKVTFQVEAHVPSMLLGALVATVITVALISFVSRVSRVKEDTAIGIMYTGIFAAGVVLVSLFRNYIHIDIVHFIMGDVLGVTDADLWGAGIVAVIVLTMFILFFRQLQITSFDPVMAASLGIPVPVFDYMLTTCVGLVVVSAVSMVGVILVVGLLITPAATAYMLSDRLDRMMWLSALFGLTSVLGGLYFAMWMDSAGGGAIMLFSTLQFIVVLVVAPRYGLLAGWLRRRRMIPQRLYEDILGSVLRNKGRPMPLATLAGHVEEDKRRLQRAVHSMASDNLLKQSEAGLTLTRDGKRRARRLLRAHRLWETYLSRAGLPSENLHQKAHQLEHIHDEEAVDWIDHRLGHPLKDPHGKEIIEDFVHLVPGEPVSLSLLRPGRQGEVTKVDREQDLPSLIIGQTVRVVERDTEMDTWTIELPDGVSLTLTHAQADGVTVRLLEN